MPDEALTIDERYKLLRLHQKKYLKASKSEKGAILNHLETATGLHRGSLKRLLNGPLERKKRQKQRGVEYGPEVDDALRVISAAHNYACAERLQPTLPELAERLARHGEMELSASLLAQLKKISLSTVRRRLKRVYQDVPSRKRRGNVSTGHARSQIPMGRISWDESLPGHFEVDLVHHCGPESKGHFVYSLQMVDVATGWTVPSAMLGRSRRVMVDAFCRCEQRIPFPIIEIHPDNGSEFFTNALLEHWGDIGVEELSRSHPNRKNDNRFVEHRNGDMIRAWFGYWRYDTAAKTRAMNKFYTLMWLYHNFCQPVMRQISKETLESGKIRRRHDAARTPFARLKETGVLTESAMERLERIDRKLNPKRILERLHAQVDIIAQLPPAQEAVTEDIFDTLLLSSLRKEEGIR